MIQALGGKGCLPWNTLLEYRCMQHLEHNGARPLIKACTVPPETLWGNLMVEAIVRRSVISGNCMRNYYCIEVCKSCTSFASEAAACGQGYMDLMSNPAPSFVFNSSLDSFQLHTCRSDFTTTVNMPTEVEGTHKVGDVSLYTKTWLVSCPLPR
jgi:hypothetical protein